MPSRFSCTVSNNNSRQENIHGLNNDSYQNKLVQTSTLAKANGEKFAFTEPPLAKPAKGATGQPLEEPPNSVSKKELNLGLRKRRLTPEERDDARQNEYLEHKKEKIYTGGLNTRSSEEITRLSELRTRPEVKKEPLKLEEEEKEDKEDIGSRIRKRILRPKKEVTLRISLKKLNSVETENTESSVKKEYDEAAKNQDFCASCGLPGSFICCEECPKSFHFHCLSPPMDPAHLPDYWICNGCRKNKLMSSNHQKSTHPKNVGIFAKMLDDLEYINPSSFMLPRDISDAFEGVAVDKFGDYIDDNFKPVKTYRQICKEKEDPLHEIYDQEGNVKICYKCGGSGLNHQELIKCDYCPLYWHLDCLDPPMASVKQLGTKWKCPNHADNVIAPKLKLRHQPSVEIAATRGVKISPDSNVEIDNIEDAEPFDQDATVDYLYDSRTAKQQLQGKKLYKFENGKTSLHYNLSEPMQRYKKYLKLGNVTYRFKEEGVILDFIKGSRIKKLHDMHNMDQHNLHLYGKLEPDLKGMVSSLCKLSKREIASPQQKQINFENLLNVANADYKIENEKLDKQELRKLMMVKALMERKGEDKMMNFLRS